MERKKKILFVDDEPNVLRGLRRSLHSMRDRWDMEFVEDPAKALEALDGGNVDVVVSDMRMPRMSGDELLHEVSRRHPQTIRFALSGQADETMILRAVGAVHQYLSKPCDPEFLKEAVSRACEMREVLKNDKLKRKISQMNAAPSLPSICREVFEQLESAEPSLDRAADLIATDIGMSLKTLQLVSSPFFGPLRHVSNPADGARLLGAETLRSLALQVNAFSPMKEDKIEGLALESIWTHSRRVSALAKAVAGMETDDRAAADHAHLAGLFHDVGKLVFASKFPAMYAQAEEMSRENQDDLLQIEREILCAGHGEAGAYLVGLWGLPRPIVEAVAFHQSPLECGRTDFAPLSAVYAADLIVRALECGAGWESAAGGRLENDRYIAEMGKTGRVSGWIEAAKNLFLTGAFE